MKINKVLLVVAGLLLIMTMAVQADQLLDVTFNGDTIGNAPTTAPGVNTIQAIGGYTATDFFSPPSADCGTITVQNVAGMDHAAVMTTNTANEEIGALWMDTSYSAVTSQLFTSFDISILAAPALATSQPKGQYGILFGVNTFTDQGHAALFAVAPTSDTGGIFAFRNAANNDLVSIGTYVNGQTYHISYAEDFAAGTVNGNQFGTGWTSPVTASETFMFLNGQSGYANQVAIDNLSVSTTPVPEPSSMLALACGLTGLIGLRLRKK